MDPSEIQQTKKSEAFRKEHALRASVYLYSPAFRDVVSSLLALLPGTSAWYVSEDGERIEFIGPGPANVDPDLVAYHACENSHQMLEKIGHAHTSNDNLITTKCSHGRRIVAVPVRLRNAPAGYLALCGTTGKKDDRLKAGAEILRAHVRLLVTMLAEHDDIELVQEVWRMMTSSMKLNDLLEVALSEVLNALGVDRGMIILFGDDGQAIVKRTRGVDPHTPFSIPLSFSYLDYRSILDPKSESIQAVAPGSPLFEWATHIFQLDLEKLNLCVMPFVRAEKVLGFALVPGRPELPDEYDKRLVLRTLMSGISALIYGLINIEEIKERRLSQRTIHALFRSAGYWESKQDLLQMACELTVRAVEAEKGSIMLLDETRTRLEPAARVGLKDGEVGTARVPVGHGLPGYTADLGEQAECTVEEGRVSLREPLEAYPDRYYICFPLARDEVFGVLTLSSNSSPFEAGDKDLLKAMCEALGVLVENALLREKQRRLNLDILRRLTNTLETGNPNTGGRTGQRTDLALRIGRSLNLTDSELADIEYASLLAQGGIGDTQSGESDRAASISHLTLSKRITECMRPSDTVLGIIRHLSENYDGTGKPDGLTGDKIPLGSRIIACASTFVLTIGPEKPYWAVVKTIEADAGTRFDPRIVATLSEVISHEY